MAKAKKATDPSATKTTRSRKPVAAPQENALAATSEPISIDRTSAEELIRRRAYELFLERQGNGGTPEEDWARAEFEILGKSA
jgi:hypothetical protein